MRTNSNNESVLQAWVHALPYMQQSVLITACRGPDGLPKNHISKVLIRWMRRCYMKTAFTGLAFVDPYQPGGGSFTGPCTIHEDHGGINAALDAYLAHVDETPHHFHMHFMHAAEILGYKHNITWIRNWWREAYFRIANDAHLVPEDRRAMERRLGDNEQCWREAEEVTAH